MRVIGQQSAQDAATAAQAAQALTLASAPRCQVRQAALTGPIDASGRADFLQAGAGLQVVTKTLSPALLLSFGDGLGAKGPIDQIVQTAAAITWSALTASSTNYLYVNLANEVLAAGHSTLAPIYSQARPSSPATGQYWYPTDHRSRGEVWSGSAWVPVVRLYLGQVIANATVPTEIRSYAYQGWWEGSQAVVLDSQYNLNHNIGVAAKNLSVGGTWEGIGGSSDTSLAANGSGGYPLFDGARNSASEFLKTDHVLAPTTLRIRTHSVALWSGQLSSNSAYSFTSATAAITVRRAF